jgi:RimJ/RimL family protein N-acetyltransferase
MTNGDERQIPIDSVTLRPVVDADIAVLYAQQADPDASAMANFPSRDEPTHAAHWTKIRSDPKVIIRAILVDGRLAGNVLSFLGAHESSSGAHERDVGYWVGREFWGQGVASIALEQFLKVETVRPLFARVAPTNPGSQRVLSKCGFSQVGPSDGDLLFRLDSDQETDSAMTS